MANHPVTKVTLAWLGDQDVLSKILGPTSKYLPYFQLNYKCWKQSAFSILQKLKIFVVNSTVENHC